MFDQAHKLRQMMGRAKRPATGMRQVVVSGGCTGVGATTIAVELATSLARQGHRTVLVDADAERADATRRCQIEAYENLGHVLAGRRTIHEILQPGPAGIQVLPGVTGDAADFSPAAQERLARELATLSRYADFTIVDAGSAQAHTMRYWWQRADAVLLVATPTPEAILDAYAAVKMHRDLAGIPGKSKIQTVVNRAENAEAAEAVQARLQDTCRRFLNVEIGVADWLGVEAAGQGIASAVCEASIAAGGSLLAQQIERLAEFVAGSVRTSLANTA